MDDRELLELAAKAAGIDERRLPDAWPNRFDDDQWNPLIDDGDALRLAVKLGIDLEWRNDGRVAAYGILSVNGRCFAAFESSREERYAATRRAIVRAAAEIGKTK